MTWTAVLPIVGTLLGVGAGVLLNSGSEHRKWLREKRHAAYTAVMEAMRAHNPTASDEEKRDATARTLMLACRKAELVAPTTVRYAMIRLMADGITDRTGKEYRKTRDEVLHLMRKDLRIAQRSFKEVVHYRYYRLRHPIQTREWKKKDDKSDLALG